MGKLVELIIQGEQKGEALAKQVIASVKLHQNLMGLDDWYGKIVFAPVEDEDGGDIMETECHPQYKKFTITVDLNVLNTSPEYLQHYVRHELFHVLVWFMFDLSTELSYKKGAGAIRKLEERVIYDLEHMPLWDLVYVNKEDE